MRTSRTVTILAAAAALLVAMDTWAEKPKLTPALVAQGKASYQTHCLACHGPRGLGDGEACAALDLKARNFAREPFKNGRKPAQAFATLNEGIAGSPMVSFSHLPEEELWGLSYYVLILRTAGKGD